METLQRLPAFLFFRRAKPFHKASAAIVEDIFDLPARSDACESKPKALLFLEIGKRNTHFRLVGFNGGGAYLEGLDLRAS